MEYEEFITLIQQFGRIEQFGVAERAVSAVLEVLGEHLSEEQAISIARQLPTHIRDAIMTNNVASSFGLDEFIRRVADREEIGPAEAEKHIRAVFSVLTDAIDLDKARDAIARLPEDIRALLSAEQKAAFSGMGGT
ncbi:MAG: DUF2267 domain-containing protein [Nitrospirota bacterium]